MTDKQRIEELEDKLQDLRCDFERFREWARKGPYGFNFRDEKSVERQREHGCK